MIPIMALLAAASVAQQAMHKDPAQLMTPSGRQNDSVPGAQVGGVSSGYTPVPGLDSPAIAYPQMAQALPQNVNVPTNLLAAVRTDAQGNQPILQALQQGQQPQPSDLLNLLRQGRDAYAPAPAQTSAKKGDRKPAVKDYQAPQQQDSAPSDGQAVAYNPAPGSNTNDVETTGIGKLTQDAASSGSGGQTFMGLSGKDWGSIGQAAGVLANLMKPLPPRGVLTPGSRGAGGIPMAPVGSDLSQPGAQRLGETSQFAIHSPDISGSEVLRALRGQG